MSHPKLIYQGRVIKVFKEKRLLPNGLRIDLDLIRHPGAVLMIPFLDRSHLVFIRQFRPVVRGYLYELPAGTLDRGETPLDCARREIMEETGFSAKRFSLIGKIYPVPGYSTEKILIYEARGLKKEPKPGDADEIIQRRIFNKSEVTRLFKTGRIVDAKTISALAFCGWL
jgi:8-oxo-dGTP pyrophosphatase MutT (NUDIX family)